MATFEKRGKRWRVRVRINGRDRSASFTTKAEAKAWAARMETEALASRTGFAPEHLTVTDLLERYMQEVSPTKRGGDKEAIRIKRIIGQGRAKPHPLCRISLGRVSRFDIQRWRDDRLKEVSPSSVARELSTIKAAFTWATHELGWFHDSPAAAVKAPQKPPPRNRRVSDDEIEAIKQAAGYVDGMQPKMVKHQAVHAFLLALETAMRAGEIVNMRWDNVNFDKRFVHLEMTKNGEPRDVPLSSRALELIEKMRGLGHDKVFTITSASLDATFRKIRKAAGLMDLTFHDSRAEALTRLSKKLDVMRLARISGHKDIKILYNTYYRETAEDISKLLD